MWKIKEFGKPDSSAIEITIDNAQDIFNQYLSGSISAISQSPVMIQTDPQKNFQKLSELTLQQLNTISVGLLLIRYGAQTVSFSAEDRKLVEAMQRNSGKVSAAMDDLNLSKKQVEYRCDKFQDRWHIDPRSFDGISIALQMMPIS